MRRKKVRPPSDEGIDLAALQQRPDAANITLVDAFAEGGDKARAGEKIARVQQRYIDRLYFTDRITREQFDAAVKWWSSWLRAMGGNPSFEGVFIESIGRRDISERQMAGYVECMQAAKAIRNSRKQPARHVGQLIILHDDTIRAVRRRMGYGEYRVRRLLNMALDDLQAYYGL